MGYVGIRRGTADFYGITLYLRGGYMPSGHTPENGSNYYDWGKISNAGKYKIYTRASYCEGFVNGAVRYESYFPIMKMRWNCTVRNDSKCTCAYLQRKWY